MALFNFSAWQRSRFTLQWFLINLVGSLACLPAVALAQFDWSEGVSGSVTIPDVAFTCLGNLAVFMTAFTRGRLDMENGARDVLATIRGPKLNAINGCGLSTLHPNDLKDVDVVLLSKYNERPHSSLTQFMQYISHSHALESVLLQFFPFTSPHFTAEKVTAEKCECGLGWHCRCVVFRGTEEIVIMLARRLPGTLKRLSKSLWLLPTLRCLKNGCHGCNQGLLYVEAAGESSELGTSEGRLREDNPRVDSPAAVCEALNESLIEEEESSCICIPVHPRNADRWTKFMIKFLKSKEKEAKGIKVVVSDALQHYITQSAQELGLLFQTLTGCIVVSEIYDSASLILPRVAEVIVNMGLTGWLRVDGFSSSLVARRAIRDYVVDSTIAWSGLIAWEVTRNWAPSMPLSTPRVSVIIGAVGVALGMDCFDRYGAEVRALFSGEERAEERAEGRAWALTWPLVPLRAWSVAGAGILSEGLAGVRALAWSQSQVRAQGLAEDEALARAAATAELGPEARVDVELGLEAQAATRADAATRVRALALSLDMAQPRARAWALDRARARIWGLVAVVILEVGCIVSLVVRLSMKKGVGRWVYSGMQVLVWVKWGIGSFLLGDNATEGEDGSPYLRIRNRGTWVYCSAFLLNAILAGVRRKWVYTI